MESLGGATAVELCEHFLLGGRPERARKYLEGGLEHLSRGYLNDAAIALADRALEIPGLLEGPGRLRILMRKVRWVGLMGRREEERRILDEALRLATEAGDTNACGNVEWRRGRLELHVSNFEQARRRFEAARECARAAGNRQLEARALSGLGILSVREGRLDEARERHEQAAVVAREIGFRAGEAMAAGNLGHVHWILGNYTQALQLFKRDLALCRELDDRGAEAESALNMGVICRSLGRIEEARAHYESALGLLRQVGDRRSEAIGRSNLGNVLQDFGWVADARSEFQASLELAIEVEYRMGEVTALVSLGNLEVEAGRKTRAQRILKRGLRLARRLGAGSFIVEATAALALLPGGDAQAALDAYGLHEEALQQRDRMRLRFRLWQATGDRAHLDEAHRLLIEIRDLAPSEFRESMIAKIPLHREIVLAAQKPA
jgi:tetratricopeptide (TPR) repeat protein